MLYALVKRLRSFWTISQTEWRWPVSRDVCLHPVPVHNSSDIVSCNLALQTISFRDGYYNEIMSAKTGFAPETFLCDSTNPNPLGHR